MNTDTSSLGGLLARMPNGFRIDRLIGAMVVVARKELDSSVLKSPVFGLTSYGNRVKSV
jgi:hypothetical protein